MAKYLLLKHYRGAPAAVNDVPMDQWTPEEVSAHVQYMQDFATRLEGTGEFVDGQALSPDGVWVRSDGAGRPPVTDGPFAETKDLIAGWMVIDVDTYEMTPEQRVEWEAEVRSLYDGMVRIVVTPTWAKLIDFETTLPSAVEELIQQRDERQRAQRGA